MKKLLVVLAVTSVLCSSAILAESLEERVLRAASVTYIHGMTQEIADREIGPEGVDVLLGLLRDPDFERRDNVVAFLVYLGRDADSPALVRLLDDPPGDESRPEEYRAKLMVPEALGRIAAKGGSLARSLLNDMQDAPGLAEESGLAKQVDYGVRLMNGQTEAIQPVEPALDTEPPFDPGAIDPLTFSSRIAITYGNHIDTNNKITNVALDAALADATRIMNFENDAADTACCIELKRSGHGGTFGNAGDGLDVITTSTELTAVINNPIGRVKVVDYIGWCGGAGTGIIGCGYTPGKGMVVVRMSTPADEGKLWVHELGHNTGLAHNPTYGFIMFASFSSYNTKLTASECNRYHYPSGQAAIPSDHFGDCHDADGDNLVSTTDNCPYHYNAGQQDADADGLGDTCDNCVDEPNPDQEDCDRDGIGDACDDDMYPPPIEGLKFTSATALSWSPVFLEKRVYRGSVAAGAAFVENHQMVDELSAFTSGWTHSVDPPLGAFFYYYVTTFNDCGESP